MCANRRRACVNKFKYDISYVISAIHIRSVQSVLSSCNDVMCIFFIAVALLVPLLVSCWYHFVGGTKVDTQQQKVAAIRAPKKGGSRSTGIIHQVQCLAELIACATFTFCTEPCFAHTRVSLACLFTRSLCSLDDFCAHVRCRAWEREREWEREGENFGKSALKLFRAFLLKRSPPHFYGLHRVAVQSSNPRMHYISVECVCSSAASLVSTATIATAAAPFFHTVILFRLKLTVCVCMLFSKCFCYSYIL